MSRTEAVEALYQDMAARHRARFRSIHVCTIPPLSLREWQPGMSSNKLTTPIRSSVSLSSRSPTMSSAPTSSSS